jgi:hypothetical protein
MGVGISNAEKYLDPVDTNNLLLFGCLLLGSLGTLFSSFGIGR